MSQPVTERVLVIGSDARVRAALAALITATPGRHVADAIGTTADPVAIGRSLGATVVIVDVDGEAADGDAEAIRELAEHLTVIAVGNAAAGRARALQAGAIAVCDKIDDPDALTEAVKAAGRRHLAHHKPTTP